MKTFLKIITYVFQPLLMPTYAVILMLTLFVFKPFTIHYYLLAVLGTLFFTTILPAIPIFLLIKMGLVKDIFISNRRERTLPYIFSLLAYVAWVIFLNNVLLFPFELILIAIGTVLSVILMVIINLRWKISAHMAGIGGILGCVVAISFILSINPLLLMVGIIIISALVAISRILLKAHTPLQVLGGFFLGFLCTSLPLISYYFIIFGN